MYESYYGLAEKPFALTPNPRYVYHSEAYRAALDHLQYGVQEKEGFMLLTAPVGTGKTTLCRELLQHLEGESYRTALIFNPFLNALEMLQALLTEFGCSYPPGASKKDLLDRLNRFLLSQLVAGRTCVAIFDEAQHLSAEFLEQIRVLSNLETDREKLVHIILVGQPELRERIQQPSLAQLDQRVSLRCTLRHLNLEETERYIYHRLNVAGAQGRLRFSSKAVAKIYTESSGIPRLINLICERTLLAGFVAQTNELGAREVSEGVASLNGEAAGSEPSRRWWARRALPWIRPITITFTVGAIIAGIGAVAAWYSGGPP